MSNNIEAIVKRSAKRGRQGLRMRCEDLKSILDEASLELTDSHVLKVVKLILGVNKYLGDDHCYHEEQWPALARELKLRTADDLLEMVELSKLFVIDSSKGEGLRFFYYMEYKRFHDHCDGMVAKYVRQLEKEQDKADSEDAESSEEHFKEVVTEIKETFGCEEVSVESSEKILQNACKTSENFQKENECNTQTTNEIGEARARIGKGIGNKGDISLPEISPLVKDLDAALSACVGRLWKAEGPDGQLHCVRKQLLELLSLQEENESLTKVAFGYLVRMTLVDHFNRQRHQAERPRDFCKQTEAGQDAWLKSLMGSKYIASLLKQCVKDVRPLIAQAQHEQRHQHPNGVFEWYDPMDAKRYYDDPTEGVMEIPSDLPPRPDATAVIHPMTHQWFIQEGS